MTTRGDHRRQRRPLASSFAFGIALLCVAHASAASTKSVVRSALEGDAAAVEKFLGKHADEIDVPAKVKATPACPGYDALTLLQAAACAGNEPIVRNLMAHKADPEIPAADGQTAMLLAMTHGHDEVASLLIGSRVNLEATDSAGNTALILATSQGNSPLLQLLLKQGASPTARNARGESALLLARDADTAKMLAALGADPLAIASNGETGLHIAARSGNASAAQFFLDQGVDPGLRTHAGSTALEVAHDSGNTVVATLIEGYLAQALRKDVAIADQAAQEGRVADALSLYSAAITKAAGIGGVPERDLRVRAVRYASSLPAPPPLPETARENLVRSAYLIKKGQDISLVEAEIAAAVSKAPWWADGYYNLGQVEAEQGKYEQAERNLQIFIDAVPGDPRAQGAQDRIYEARLAREEEDKIRGMSGKWVDANGVPYQVSVTADKIQVQVPMFSRSFVLTQKNGALAGTVTGPEMYGEHTCTIPAQMHPVTGRLAPDAQGIDLEYVWSRYQPNFHCVNMAGIPSNCCLLCSEVCDSVTVSGTDRMSVQLRPAP
jgi:tetratricopeptide (TPR) repeat protein